MRGLAALPPGCRILVDSAPIAYLLEGHPLAAEPLFKLPDAFQLAACILNGCEALATHDRDFRRVTEVKILDVV